MDQQTLRDLKLVRDYRATKGPIDRSCPIEAGSILWIALFRLASELDHLIHPEPLETPDGPGNWWFVMRPGYEPVAQSVTLDDGKLKVFLSFPTPCMVEVSKLVGQWYRALTPVIPE